VLAMIELVVPAILLVLGMALLAFSSGKTVDHCVKLACNWKIPPIIIGLSLVSVGTDFPEIMNSIISSSLGYGSINVGDSIGSAFVQLTLVLGIVAISLRQFAVDRKEVAVIGIATILSLLLSFSLIADGYISRFDGFLLVFSWVIFILFIRRIAKKDFSCPARRTRSVFCVIVVILGFVGVAVGTYMVINSILEISRIFNISEFTVSFFVASVGTSLPELTVTIAAFRKGQNELAIGDIMGSSLLDSSISIGIGPLLFPTLVSGGPAIFTWLYVIFGILIVTLLLSLGGKVDKKVGIICLSIYLISYALLSLPIF
jgi:cation:H+ antiporter